MNIVELKKTEVSNVTGGSIDNDLGTTVIKTFANALPLIASLVGVFALNLIRNQYRTRQATTSDVIQSVAKMVIPTFLASCAAKWFYKQEDKE